MRRRRAGDGDDRRAAELIGAVVDVATAELDDLLRREERLVLVDFWTPGCEPCRELRARLEALAAEHAGVCTVIAVNAAVDPAAASRHGVSAFPTLVFFKRGRELRRFRGGALPASTLRLLAGGE